MGLLILKHQQKGLQDLSHCRVLKLADKPSCPGGGDNRIKQNIELVFA